MGWMLPKEGFVAHVRMTRRELSPNSPRQTWYVITVDNTDIRRQATGRRSCCRVGKGRWDEEERRHLAYSPGCLTAGLGTLQIA